MKSLVPVIALAMIFSSCSDFGDKVKTGDIEIYYKNGVNKDQAQKTADMIYRSQVASGQDVSQRKSLQLTRGNGDTIILKMVVDKVKAAQTQDLVFQGISDAVSDSIFAGNPVNMVLSEGDFSPIKTIPYKKLVMETPASFGDKVVSGNAEVYYTNEFTAPVAQQLADFMNNYFHPAETYSFQLTKNEVGSLMVRMVTSPEGRTKVTDQDLTQLCSRLSAEIFQHASLVFELTDERFVAQRIFSYPNQAVQ
jgi:hypothetical protein